MGLWWWKTEARMRGRLGLIRARWLRALDRHGPPLAARLPGPLRAAYWRLHWRLLR